MVLLDEIEKAHQEIYNTLLQVTSSTSSPRPRSSRWSTEIEDKLSEKILFGEIEPGQIVIVDVEGWDGEGSDDKAHFTFRNRTARTPFAGLDRDTQRATRA